MTTAFTVKRICRCRTCPRLAPHPSHVGPRTLPLLVIGSAPARADPACAYGCLDGRWLRYRKRHRYRRSLNKWRRSALRFLLRWPPLPVGRVWRGLQALGPLERSTKNGLTHSPSVAEKLGLGLVPGHALQHLGKRAALCARGKVGAAVYCHQGLDCRILQLALQPPAL